MHTMKYIKPEFNYWSSNELNEIEAKMSGGGSSGYTPQISLVSASYDGSIMKITYRVNQTVSSSSDMRIGYECAGYLSNLSVDRMSPGLPVKKNIGTHDMLLEAPNKNCEMRPCVGVLNGDRTRFLYSFSRSWIILPQSERVSEYTVTDLDNILWALSVIGISFTFMVEEGILNVVGTMMDYLGYFGSILNYHITPQFMEGNFFRTRVFYTNMKLIIEIKEWDSRSSYNRGASPIFDHTIEHDVPRFSNSNPTIIYTNE